MFIAVKKLAKSKGVLFSGKNHLLLLQTEFWKLDKDWKKFNKIG